MPIPTRDPLPDTVLPMRPELWAEVTAILKLSPKQVQLVELLLLGMQDKEIVKALGIKMPTLRTHLDRICRRVGARGRTQLVVRVLSAAIGALEQRHPNR